MARIGKAFVGFFTLTERTPLVVGALFWFLMFCLYIFLPNREAKND